eukprot:sb/3472092/
MDQKLVENLRNQLDRLFNQLADLEECREDLEEEEYAETKQETMDQLVEFQESLEEAMSGNLSLTSELAKLKLATQTAISSAFKTPEVIRLFAKAEPAQLRTILTQIDRDVTLGKRSVEEAKPQRVEILTAIKRLGAELSAEEELSLQDQIKFSSRVNSDSVGEQVLGLVQKK